MTGIVYIHIKDNTSEQRSNMQAPNPVYEYLKHRGFWITSGQERTCSHVFFDGGKAAVPSDATADFYRVYCDALRNGIPQYAVEQRTPVFKLFVDVDLQSKAPIDDSMLDQICARLFNASRTFFVNSNSSMVACTAPPRKMASKAVYKNGIHCHWPNVFVTSSKALAFRTHCLKDLADAFGECFCNKWSDIMDPAVYRSSGLRMIGSSKKDVEGTYMPYRVFEPGGSVQRCSRDDILGNLEHWLGLTCIRCDVVKSVAAIYEDSTDESFEESVLKSDHDGTIRRMGTVEAQPIMREFERIVPTSFFKGMKAMAVYDIQKNDRHTLLVRTNCKRCLNKINGEHRSNHVYFVINEKGITQKCFCRCETLEGRKKGCCRDFSTKVGELSDVLYKTVVGKAPKPSPYSKPASVDQLTQTILKAYS